MPRAPRFLLVLTMVLLAGLVAAGCGGDGKAASSSTDVDQLLEDTFSSGKRITSGKLNLQVALDIRGTGPAQGPVNIAVSGPFQSAEDKKLPEFQLAVKFSGAGQNLTAGATSKGGKGYLAFQDQDYVVSDQVFDEFRKGYEEGQAKQGGQSGQSLGSLGIDARKWLSNPRNEGETKVGEDETIKITGDVDVPKLLQDVSSALERAGSAAGGAQPLTDAQKREIQRSVKDLDVQIYTGKEDRILRRMVVAMDLAATATNDQGLESAKVNFDLAVSDPNGDQEIDAPKDPKPFDELVGQLGGLGLGGLGAQGGGSGGAGSSGGASSDALEKYSDCIRDAGSDADKAQKCADLLTP